MPLGKRQALNGAGDGAGTDASRVDLNEVRNRGPMDAAHLTEDPTDGLLDGVAMLIQAVAHDREHLLGREEDGVLRAVVDEADDSDAAEPDRSVNRRQGR